MHSLAQIDTPASPAGDPAISQASSPVWSAVQRLIAGAALVAASPLLLILFIAVKSTSPGPFIYRQQRYGLGGKPFSVFKIRSMREGSDRDRKLERSVKSSNPAVTPVGKVMRDLKIDELPQLWNICRGDMAFVGPRPIGMSLQKELEQEIPGFEQRLNVRPGLSNLAQVCVIESAESENVVDDWRLRFEAELHYLRNRSTSYDILVILITTLYLLKKLLWSASSIKSRVRLLVIAGIAGVGLSGCASLPQPAANDSAVVSSKHVGAGDESAASDLVDVETVEVEALTKGKPEAQYRVGPGDVLSVNIYGEPGMDSLSLPVDADGYIQLPVVERAKVGGKTTSQIQNDLKQAFSKKFKKPWVVVLVEKYTSRPIYLLGEFNAPGVVYMDRPTNIVQALGFGKGLSEQAHLRGARLIRSDILAPVDIRGLLKEGRSEQNLWLEAGDTIYIPSIADQKIVILGAVNQPGASLMGNEQMGLMEGLARAKGVRQGDARLDEVRIIRSLSPVAGEFITVDAKQIFSGAAPDFPLQAGDVVYVPQNKLADWNDVIKAITPTFSVMVSSLQPFVQLKFLTENE